MCLNNPQNLIFLQDRFLLKWMIWIIYLTDFSKNADSFRKTCNWIIIWLICKKKKKKKLNTEVTVFKWVIEFFIQTIRSKTMKYSGTKHHYSGLLCLQQLSKYRQSDWIYCV